MFRPDTGHGLVLIIVVCCVWPMLTAVLFELLCLFVLIWTLAGATYLAMQFFYRGFRYGAWES